MNLDARFLGAVDTFRFEEKALLGLCSELVASRDYQAALELITERSRSFWVDRDVQRQAQWEACGLMAEVGRETSRVEAESSKIGKDARQWLEAYAGEAAWYRVDLLYRQMESWVAKMDDEPEAAQALGLVRRDYEELEKRMASGFSEAFRAAGWAIAGSLHQSRIYPRFVEPGAGRKAYFMVDSLRYEMGVELGRQLQGALDLSVRPAVAALPSITPLGMAALMPGASADYSVLEQKGRLAAQVDGSPLGAVTDRMKYLKAKVPGAVDLTLGKVLSMTQTKLSSAVNQASLVVVRSQEIDFVGEMDEDLLARQLMDTIVGNLARAVKKLAAAGIEHFVITADHGHQFSIRKDEDMRIENPGGDVVEVHRRCWVGKGGSTPPGTIRVTGAELGYATDLEFVFPSGLGVFKAGGGLGYHHGGLSLQEVVIPVLSFRMPDVPRKLAATQKAKLAGVPDKVTSRTFGLRVGVTGDLFSTDPVPLRVIVVSKEGEQIGQAGMAVGGELDRPTGVLRINPGAEASVGMMLTRDDRPRVRIVILDPATDAVLDQSDELPVKLGI